MEITIVASKTLESKKVEMEKEANNMYRENWSVYAIAEHVANKYCCAVSVNRIEKDQYVMNCFKGF